MYTTKDKYLPLEIGIGKFPTIIIGQNPGKTRKGKYSPFVWDGDTRTSNLLREATDGYGNIILTNVCNYQYMSEENLLEGIEDLIKLINKHKPRFIICLGEYAMSCIKELARNKKIRCRNGDFTAVYKLSHPSYIIRFNKDKQDYMKSIRSILDEARA